MDIIAKQFDGMMAQWYPNGCPPAQRSELEKAFFGGAATLFGSIIAIMDPGVEITDKDLDMMSSIQDELDRFSEKIIADLPTDGRA